MVEILATVECMARSQAKRAVKLIETESLGPFFNAYTYKNGNTSRSLCVFFLIPQRLQTITREANPQQETWYSIISSTHRSLSFPFSQSRDQQMVVPEQILSIKRTPEFEVDAVTCGSVDISFVIGMNSYQYHSQVSPITRVELPNRSSGIPMLEQAKGYLVSKVPSPWTS